MAAAKGRQRAGNEGGDLGKQGNPDGRAGEIGRAAGRLYREGPRVARLGAKSAMVSFNAFGKVVHLLWLEVTGFFFLCFAAIGAAATWRAYQRFAAGAPASSTTKVAVGVLFTAMFGWFGVTSMFKARRRDG